MVRILSHNTYSPMLLLPKHSGMTRCCFQSLLVWPTSRSSTSRTYSAFSGTTRRRTVVRTSQNYRSCLGRGLATATDTTEANSTAGKDIYDIVCVGGGPAGLSLLAALQSSQIASGLRLALVEGGQLSTFNPQDLPSVDSNPFSNRCISLTPTSATFLQKIGVWDRLDHSRIQSYDKMHAWDGVTGAKISFDRTESSSFTAAPGLAPGEVPEPTSAMAYMIENLNLTSTITNILRESGRVKIFSPVKVDRITSPPPTGIVGTSPWPEVSLSSGQTLSARLLIGADGANSPVRTFAQIEAHGWDYNQHGVVASLTLDHDPGYPRTAYQRFLPTGPVAMLPLPGNKATLVWSTRPDIATKLKGLPEAVFGMVVNAAFRLSPADLNYIIDNVEPDQIEDEVRWRLSKTKAEIVHPPTIIDVQPHTIAGFPLRMRQSDSFVAERVALMGDAAHVMHPLAGQGLNQGQADAAALVGAIERGIRVGADIGFLGSREFGSGGSPLSQYEKERFAMNLAFGGFTDKMNKLFGPASGPVVWARSAGLKVVDSLPGLKGWFMNQASGKV